MVIIPTITKEQPISRALVAALQHQMVRRKIVPQNKKGRNDFVYNQPTISIMKDLGRRVGFNLILRKGPQGEVRVAFVTFKNAAEYSFFMLQWGSR